MAGDSLRDYCVAIVIPDVDVWKELDGRFNSMQAICNDKESVQILLDDLISVGRQNNLRGFELVKKVCLCQTVMTVENGLLTPTLKVKRKDASKLFEKEIEALYI